MDFERGQIYARLYIGLCMGLQDKELEECYNENNSTKETA